MIICQNLRKEYGRFVAVRDVNLQVERGEIFGFLGPNGAGKTTCIKLLMGLLIPTSGCALIDGLDAQIDRVEVARRVGYLPDSPVFLDFLRGRELVSFVAEMHGISRQAARTRALAMMQKLDLKDAQEDFANNYSTGMKKRLGLACALIHEPPILILDEPTNGLDPRSARQIRELIQAYADSGRTVLLSTHLLDMAEKLCHRVGIIHHGELVATGSPSELQQKLAPLGTLEEIFLQVTQPDSGPA